MKITFYVLGEGLQLQLCSVTGKNASCAEKHFSEQKIAYSESLHSGLSLKIFILSFEEHLFLGQYVKFLVLVEAVSLSL